MLAAGARVIHVDVMDGHFVPPITFGALVVEALADLVHDAGGMLDVHLMIERPERHVEEFARAGADTITIHAEATPHVHYTLARSASRVHRWRGDLPGTPADALVEVADHSLDLALCMSVNPGWGGQRSSRIRWGSSSGCARAARPVALEVDGGIHDGPPARVAPGRTCSSPARPFRLRRPRGGVRGDGGGRRGAELRPAAARR